MTRRLRRRPGWHRWLGRLSGTLVLGALVPSGIVLAFEAKGGVTGTLGFLLSGAIVAVSMARGVSAAQQRNFASHRRAMHHVVAQMSVAVTSRALILLLDGLGRANDIVGCVYRESERIYVKIGEAYRPAEFLLGKDAQPVTGVCESAAPSA